MRQLLLLGWCLSFVHDFFTCLGFAAELQGQSWWPFFGRGNLRCGQCVKAAGVLLGLQLPGLNGIVESPQALLDGAFSLVWDGLGHEDVHQNGSRVLRGC